MPRQVLVTGAAGFIGSHLTDKILALGREVVGFDNLSSGTKANVRRAMQNPRFRFVEGDLLDFEGTRSVLGEMELVFHLAADPEVRLGQAYISSSPHLYGSEFVTPSLRYGCCRLHWQPFH